MRFRPNRQLALVHITSAPALTAALVVRQELAFAELTPETNETAFNAIVSRSNVLRTELGAGVVNARLERQVGEVLQAWDYLRDNNELPEDWNEKFPWMMVGLGALVVGGIWWWAWGEKRDTMIAHQLATGEIEDCGCGG